MYLPVKAFVPRVCACTKYAGRALDALGVVMPDDGKRVKFSCGVTLSGKDHYNPPKVNLYSSAEYGPSNRGFKSRYGKRGNANSKWPSLIIRP